jgi:hypothetical protein
MCHIEGDPIGCNSAGLKAGDGLLSRIGAACADDREKTKGSELLCGFKPNPTVATGDEGSRSSSCL